MVAAKWADATPEEHSDDAQAFHHAIMSMVDGLGGEGANHALETLFAISDLVLDNRYCAEHTVRRIREILSEAMPETSEEES